MSRSKKEKVWEIRPRYPESFDEQFPEFHPLVKQMLFARGLHDQAAVDEFLQPDFSKDLHDPFLFRDMEKAATRIWAAVAAKERILVYGDYDADGVCSTTVLTDFFHQVGVDPRVYIPHRETEGYGLNLPAVQQFIADQVELVITVDCGTTNTEEIEALQQAGIDVIVVDHHHVGSERARPFAFLNCSDKSDSYPFDQLAAVGMAFKLVQGLLLYAQRQQQPYDFPVGWEKWLLDLVAIATVTDVMPLTGENHTLVKYGLVVLNKTRRPGLQALMTAATLTPGTLTTWELGFIIGPRLNAAGRIDHANNAYELLNARDEATAEQYAEQLQRANKERQQLTDVYVKEAKEQVKDQADQGKNLLVAFSRDWDLGLVGLVAGRLVEAYRRPAVAITVNEGKVMGSGRSLPGFSIIDAVGQVSRYLSRYGGHDQACGFTVTGLDQLSGFTEALQEQASGLSPEIFQVKLFIDVAVPLGEINWSLYEDIEKFEPYGEGNPQPRFLSEDLQVLGVNFVGDGNKHLRVMVADEQGVVRKTIGFGLGEAWGDLQMGDRVDLVYEVGVNQWNGNRELQLKIIDLRKK